MTERETVKQEIARLRRELSDLEWNALTAEHPNWPGQSIPRKIQRAEMRIDYLTREYVARGIEYEPNF